MKIEIIKCLQDNYSYLIIDKINRNACVVDPGEAKPIINDEVTLNWEEKNTIKRNKLLNIINECF